MDKPFRQLSVEVSRFFFGDEHMFVHLAGDFCWYILLIHSRLDHPSRADARCAAQIEGQKKRDIRELDKHVASCCFALKSLYCRNEI